MLGFFTAITGIVTYEAMEKALPGSVPEKALDLNIKAFEKGYNFGLELQKKQKDPQ
jgi:2-oxoglutarate ferredoxin oxidoreductase subunit gamma